MTMDLPKAPKNHGMVEPKLYSDHEIEEEAKRLIESIKQPERWTLEHCKTIAPYTLEINELKKQKDVYLIAHSYQHQILSMELQTKFQIVILYQNLLEMLTTNHSIF